LSAEHKPWSEAVFQYCVGIDTQIDSLPEQHTVDFDPSVVVVTSSLGVSRDQRKDSPLVGAGFAFGLVLSGIVIVGAILSFCYFQFSLLQTDWYKTVVVDSRTDDEATDEDRADEGNQSNSESQRRLNLDELRIAFLARQLQMKMGLLSCANFGGLALLGLGFALFLVTTQSEFDVEASNARTSIKLMRIAPGAFVLLCACLMVTYVSTQQFEVDLRTKNGETRGGARGGGVAKFAGDNTKLLADVEASLLEVETRDRYLWLAGRASVISSTNPRVKTVLSDLSSSKPDSDSEAKKRALTFATELQNISTK
jgi:hypothetical protein